MPSYKSARPSSIVIPSSNRSITSNDLLSWKNDQILLWLKNAGYTDDMIDAFRAHNITGLTLPYINTEELKDMGIINLKSRLNLMKDINDLLVDKGLSTMKFGVGSHPMLNELQALVISTNLASTLTESMDGSTLSTMNSTSMSNKSLINQFNKLKEDLLPVLKEIKDKKPLPTPDHTTSASAMNTSPKNPHITSATSSKHNTSLSAKKVGYRKSISSPPIISPIVYDEQPVQQMNKLPNNSKSTLSVHTLDPNSQNGAPRSPNRPQLFQASSSGSVNRHHHHLRQSLLNPSSAATTTPTIIASPSPQTPPIPSNPPPSLLPGTSSTASTSTTQPQSSRPSSEPLKQLRAKTDDPCYKILQSAMKRHNLDKNEWKKYVLVICYGGDQERIIGYDEKPVLVFKELNELGLNPSMMLRQVDDDEYENESDNTNGGSGFNGSLGRSELVNGTTPGGRL